MGRAEDTIGRWQAEYAGQGGLPSSQRATPSGSVVWAVAELWRQNFPLRTAIDVGCGKGRNSLYLAHEGAQVTALDFTPNAVAALEAESAARGLGGKIRALVHDVTEPWPVGGEGVDLVVDAFCFKHIAPYELRCAYKENLLAALGIRGHYLISFASIGDGYYGRYVTPDGAAAGEAVVIDPVNSIESVLFSRDRVVKFFAPELDLCGEMQHNKPSEMHGEVYERATYALLFRRRPGRFVS